MFNKPRKESIREEIRQDEYFNKTHDYLDEDCEDCGCTGLWLNIITCEVVCNCCGFIL